ncbi:transporter associated domain-containing protein [Tepidanaerobacter syntrophicus]|uniref:Transporter associated domain-containing protein n=1 Tax=Tepidanaerobacter syntrophicus TaxID=224999 RepID=A0A0U9HPI7_9FIRM|nr:transporter associated domain-containing protein [Tepidanaerobacter syntrophicus]GAQ26307.1 transporter associated domain-containing protein [Tepidanaerobacter syntrophicus]GLI19295.1 transporter [Tepidanaerobacter syntrophicus]
MKISSRIAKTIIILESVLAFFVILGVIVGSVDILRYLKIIYETPPTESFPIVQAFLGHILALVIGLELAVMLIKHTPASVIEVLLYAIARKMLIDSKNMLDIVLGILAVGGLFYINKHFEPAKTFFIDANIVNPAMLIGDLNKKLHTNIPENIANTIGGLVVKLCKEGQCGLSEGKSIRVNDAEITILSMDGELIRELKVVKCDEKDE